MLRTPVDLVGGRILDDQPIAHDGDVVGEHHRLLLVVGHEDRGGAESLMQPLDLAAHPRTERGVEIRERLVEEEDLRLLDHRARERDTLLLTAGELGDAPLEEVVDLQGARDAAHAHVDLAPRLLGELEREGHVAVDVHVRIEGVILEDHRHVALVRRPVGDALCVEEDLATGGGLQPGDQVERRRLAAPRGPEERDECPVVDLERHATHRPDGAKHLLYVV